MVGLSRVAPLRRTRSRPAYQEGTRWGTATSLEEAGVVLETEVLLCGDSTCEVLWQSRRGRDGNCQNITGDKGYMRRQPEDRVVGMC